MILKFLQCRVAALLAAAVLAGCADSLPAPVYEIGGTLEEREAPNVERPKVYIIRRGDTLAAIALEYGLDYRQLALWNQISDPDLINTGDRLRLSPPPDSPTVAVIKPQTAAPSLQSSTGEPSLSPVREAAPAPESARIGGESAAPAAAGQAPIRDGPRAAKYPYSASALRKLRRAHQAKVAAAAVKARADSNSGNANNPAPASANTAQAAEVQAGGSAAANSANAASIGGDAAATAKSLAALTKPPLLAKSRKRFGIDWSWPTAGKVIGKFTESSKGLDIGAARRAPVYAAADGKAVYVGSGVKSYGRLVILKHKNDYLSAYAHNDLIFIKEGQRVSRGQLIAAAGDSGADRVMLHLEIRKTGKPFNPLQVLPPR